MNRANIGTLELYRIPLIDLANQSIIYDSLPGDINTDMSVLERLLDTKGCLEDFNRLQARVIAKCDVLII